MQDLDFNIASTQNVQGAEFTKTAPLQSRACTMWNRLGTRMEIFQNLISYWKRNGLCKNKTGLVMMFDLDVSKLRSQDIKELRQVFEGALEELAELETAIAQIEKNAA